MYLNTSENKVNANHPSYSTAHPRQPSKRPTFQVLRQHRRMLKRKMLKSRQRDKAAILRMLKRKMEMKNLKLYMENQSIIEENEKLRRKAILLDQENTHLLSQLQNLPQQSV